MAHWQKWTNTSSCTMLAQRRHKKESNTIIADDVYQGLGIIALVMLIIIGALLYFNNDESRAEPRPWVIESESGMPLKFTGVVVGRAIDSGYNMTLYRAEDGRYLFATNVGGNRWVVMGDQLPTSQQITDVAGWSQMTRDLLKDTGLPTEAQLPPR